MPRILFILLIAIVTTQMAAAQSQAQAGATPEKSSVLPEDAAATVHKLLALSKEEFEHRPGRSVAEFLARLTKAHAEFLDLLKVLDRQVDDKLLRKVAESASRSIELSLIEMARDYSDHPDHLTTLLRIYGSPPEAAKRFHTVRPRHPAEEHAVEKFRPAWELLLLAPSTDESRFMRRSCFEAVRLIKSDASIPVLLYLFERANSEAQRRNNNALDEQIRVLVTLGRFRNAAALRAMLRCVAISEAEGRAPRLSELTMKEWVIRFLRYEDGHGRAEKWRKVMAEVLQEKLSDADRSFLEEVLKGPVRK